MSMLMYPRGGNYDQIYHLNPYYMFASCEGSPIEKVDRVTYDGRISQCILVIMLNQYN